MLGVFGEPPPGCRADALFREKLSLRRAQQPLLGRGRLTLKRYAELPHLLVSQRRSGLAQSTLRFSGWGCRDIIALYVSHFLVAPLVVAQSDLVATLPRRQAPGRPTWLRLLPPPVALSGLRCRSYGISEPTKVRRTCGCEPKSSRAFVVELNARRSVVWFQPEAS